MKNKMFRLAWSPESLPTSEAIEPLLKTLDDNLLALSKLLMKRGFIRVLSVMWNTVLEELAKQGSDVVKSGVKTVAFSSSTYKCTLPRCHPIRCD
jgi:BAI1-associated protein 3